jgi:hypothetical protein
MSYSIMDKKATTADVHSGFDGKPECSGFHDRMRVILSEHSSEAAFAKSADCRSQGLIE